MRKDRKNINNFNSITYENKLLRRLLLFPGATFAPLVPLCVKLM
jgi:hypothetical protein